MKEILQKAIEILSMQPAFLRLNGRIMVAGDTHGDVIVSREIIKKFYDEKYDAIVFLGDYIDRAPSDVSSSAENMNYLLQKLVENPEKVFLLKGNHEANYAIPCFPHEFEYEIKPSLKEYYTRIFMEMPLMTMANNVYLAHGGFPRGDIWNVDKNDVSAIEDITWSDIAVSPVYRGAGFKFDEKMMNEFLESIGAKAFIRGHDYTMNGIVVYKKCLTIFSSRRYRYEGNGGVLVAMIDGNVEGIRDIKLQALENGKWRKYEPLFY